MEGIDAVVHLGGVPEEDARLRIPTIATSDSDASRPPVPTDRDHLGGRPSVTA